VTSRRRVNADDQSRATALVSRQASKAELKGKSEEA
jgi:hypothetical protein